jgi:hypothetical protein
MCKLLCSMAAAALVVFAGAVPEQSSTTIEGKAIAVKYTPGDARITAAFHTDVDLVFKGATVPKGDYTLYVLTEGEAWQLVISKQTGANAAVRDPKLDAGKVALKMTKAASAAGSYKLTLTKTAAMAAKLDVFSGTTVATAPFHLDRVAGDSEW